VQGNVLYNLEMVLLIKAKREDLKAAKVVRGLERVLKMQ
jgi:hypothetical protein